MKPLKCPTIPPFRFFEPISIEASAEMSKEEFLCGILKKLNSVIKELNTYTQKISDIETRLTNVENKYDDFVTEVNAIIDEFKVQILAQLATNLSESKAYTRALIAEVNQRIDQIEVGAIEVYDPTTGVKSPLQTVIDNIYTGSRTEALTASEYDSLDLTATDYDTEELTAYEYDTAGKTLLINP